MIHISLNSNHTDPVIFSKINDSLSLQCVHCNFYLRTLFSWTVVDHQHKSLCQIPIFIKSQMNFHLKCNPVNWKRILSGTMCYMPYDTMEIIIQNIARLFSLCIQCTCIVALDIVACNFMEQFKIRIFCSQSQF